MKTSIFGTDRKVNEEGREEVRQKITRKVTRWREVAQATVNHIGHNPAALALEPFRF
jgi:hypothetical protein